MQPSVEFLHSLHFGFSGSVLSHLNFLSGGGSGATGGSIGDNGQGGGGGSGYTNGEVTVVERQGVGNNGSNAFAIFELID